MAKTSSAKKAQRVSARKRVFNARHKRAVKDNVKNVSKLLAEKKPLDAQKALPNLYQAIDKAAKHGTIKKNTAARMKSRITKRVGSITK
jgi:small subunit ribosomal protein S20